MQNTTDQLEINLEALENSSKLTPNELQLFSTLSFSETLLSDHWKFRKRALELIRSSQNAIPPEIQDFFLANLELFISDMNPGSFYEFLLLLNEKNVEFLITPVFLNRILEKYCFVSSSFQSKIEDVIFKSLDNQGLVFFEEILQLLDSKNPRMLTSILILLEKIAGQKTCILMIPDTTFREIFLKTLILLESLSREVRNKALEIIGLLYPALKEDINEIIASFCKQMRPIHIKTLIDLCENIEKFPEKTQLKTLIKLELPELPPKILPQINESIDLLTLLPEKFLNIPYIFEAEAKRKTLKETIEIFEKADSKTLDFSRDYAQIFNVLTVVLEDPNLMVFNEGIRCFVSIIRIFRGQFPNFRLRSFLRILLESIKPNIPKILSVFEELIARNVIGVEAIIDIMVWNFENNSKKGVKTLVIEIIEEMHSRFSIKRAVWENIARKLEGFTEKKESRGKILPKIKGLISKIKENQNRKENSGKENLNPKGKAKETKKIIRISQAPLEPLRESNTAASNTFNEEPKESVKNEAKEHELYYSESLKKGLKDSDFNEIRKYVKKNGFFDKYYDDFLNRIRKMNQEIQPSIQIFYKEIKFLIVNCPKTLQSIETFQKFLEEFLKNYNNFREILDCSLKLMEKLGSNLKYIYSVEKSQILLRFLVFSLEQHINEHLDQLNVENLELLIARLKEIKLPGLINLPKPLYSALIRLSGEIRQRIPQKQQSPIRTTNLDTPQKEYFENTPRTKEPNPEKDNKNLIIIVNELTENQSKIKENPVVPAEKGPDMNELTFKNEDLIRVQNIKSLVESKYLDQPYPKHPHFLKSPQSQSKSLFASEIQPSAKSQFEEQLEGFIRCLHSQSAKHWKRGIGRGNPATPDEETLAFLKKVFEGFQESYTEKVFPLIFEVRDLFQGYHKELIHDVFYWLIGGGEFKDSREYFDGFFSLFFKSFDKEIVLKGFSQAFGESEGDRRIKIIRNGLFPLIYKLYDDEVSLEAMESLSEALIFCVHEPVFKNVGNEILQKLYQRIPDKTLTPTIERSLFRNKSLYLVFREWLSKERPHRPVSIELLLESPIEKPHKDAVIEHPEVSNVVTENLLELFESVNVPMKHRNLDGDEDFRIKYEEIRQRNEELEKRLVAANSEYLRTVEELSHANDMLKDKENELSSLKFSKGANFLTSEQKPFDVSFDAQDEEFKHMLDFKEKSSFATEINVKSLQETILCLDEGSDFVEGFLRFYERSNKDFESKRSLIYELKLSIISGKLLNNMSSAIHRTVLSLILRICCSDNTQKELVSNPGILEKELQMILDSLLRSKPQHKSLQSIIFILNQSLPLDFSKTIAKEQRIFYRLVMKCIEKICQSTTGLKKSFKVVLEVYKLFKRHPPEKLTEDLVNLTEFEMIYKGLKSLCDCLVKEDVEGVQEFLELVKGKEGVFLDYLKSVVELRKKKS